MQKLLISLSALTLAACSATTSFETAHSSKLEVAELGQVDASKSNYELSTTSFGQYPFKLEKEGHKEFYGILPLKFNGGYLALDILFFAPAAFFNLREVYPEYQFDIVEGAVRYRRSGFYPGFTDTSIKRHNVPIRSVHDQTKKIQYRI